MNNSFFVQKKYEVIFCINALISICLGQVNMPLLITPGYGISDYFALMPDKMLAIKVVPASKNILPGRIKSVSIYGTTVHLNLQKSIDFLPSRISLYTILGK
jgi:hypothetical protein